jgi:nicotinamidase-related amidase
LPASPATISSPRSIYPRPGEPVVEKPGKGTFFATWLDALFRMREVTHLALAGVTTKVCVQTTTREASDRGYECLLVEDATESDFPEFKAATPDMVRAQGAIVGWTATADEVLAAVEP